MLSALLSLELTKGWVPGVIEWLGVVALLALLFSRQWKRWLPIAAGAAAFGVAFGYLLCWLLGDVMDLFGVSLSPVTRGWFSGAVAAIAVAIARLVWWRGRRIAAIIASVLVFALAGGIGINVDLGEFPTLRTALGIASYGTMQLPPFDPTAETISQFAGWKPTTVLPRNGRIGMTTIPATTSHFRPRPAYIYLPPAALVANAPRLPVLVMMSGQPGGPADIFTSGDFGASLNSYAKAHNGLGPIVVVPDQLGARNSNPMCVNSALGNSARYLTVDVPAWIRSHLNVLTDPSDWAVGGFSQGGTCAIQLGAAQPGLFGNIFDIAGEVAPKNGNLQQTVDSGFGGSTAKYLAATPLQLMQSHGPYENTFAIFVAGTLDARYAPGVKTIAASAATAGMDVHLIMSNGTAHDWRTVQFAFTKSLPLLGQRWGFDG